VSAVVVDAIATVAAGALLVGVALTAIAVSYEPHVAHWREGRKHRRRGFERWRPNRGGGA